MQQLPLFRNLWENQDFVIALFDTRVFLMNEYFTELNTADFKNLNRFLNRIFSEKLTKESNFELNFVEN